MLNQKEEALRSYFACRYLLKRSILSHMVRDALKGTSLDVEIFPENTNFQVLRLTSSQPIPYVELSLVGWRPSKKTSLLPPDFEILHEPKRSDYKGWGAQSKYEKEHASWDQTMEARKKEYLANPEEAPMREEYHGCIGIHFFMGPVAIDTFINSQVKESSKLWLLREVCHSKRLKSEHRDSWDYHAERLFPHLAPKRYQDRLPSNFIVLPPTSTLTVGEVAGLNDSGWHIYQLGPDFWDYLGKVKKEATLPLI